MNHEQLKCIARVSWLCLVTGSISLGAYPTLANPPDTQPNFSIDSQSPNTDGIAQVNSVSQLSDIRPTDWALQASVCLTLVPAICRICRHKCRDYRCVSCHHSLRQR
ncbi:MAG: hypothetical protein KME52_21625 [Desmonostoc geniculatum HA4340-LM1]|nr:hypothetical protein [Desmonostoc geniculatum HA4340-LM1]